MVNKGYDISTRLESVAFFAWMDELIMNSAIVSVIISRSIKNKSFGELIILWISCLKFFVNNEYNNIDNDEKKQKIANEVETEIFSNIFSFKT